MGCWGPFHEEQRVRMESYTTRCATFRLIKWKSLHTTLDVCLSLNSVNSLLLLFVLPCLSLSRPVNVGSWSIGWLSLECVTTQVRSSSFMLVNWGRHRVRLPWDIGTPPLPAHPWTDSQMDQLMSRCLTDRFVSHLDPWIGATDIPYWFLDCKFLIFHLLRPIQVQTWSSYTGLKSEAGRHQP